MKIALDVMGGDLAPDAPILGALDALVMDPEIEIILIGDSSEIKRRLPNNYPSRLSIIHTSQVVTMDDRGATVLKAKPDSSIVKGIRFVKEGNADGFVSAGHTGAVLAASLMLFKRIRNVRRPALGVYLPTLTGGKIICDVGANPDVKPVHLLQFAVMASHYLDHVEDVKSIKIGLINIGTEPTKGNELYQESYKLLQERLPNFIGNVEGRQIFESEANVLVCDGFVGNTLLKFGEGWINVFSNEIRAQIMNRFRYKLGAWLINPVFKGIRKKFDYEEHGGTPLLGVNGVSIISHGSSTRKSIRNSIFVAKKCIQNNLIDDTKLSIEKFLGDTN